MFLDACHAGSSLGGRLAGQQWLAETLVKRSGVAVFASSRASEYSIELDREGHGAFTAALKEALEEGRADREVSGNSDGLVTAQELLAYLQFRVPRLTGNQQTPTVPLLADFGEAFPLAVVRPPARP
jgi:uncharacterized caspase-like protein